jgi:hypothetical protein
VIVHAAIQYALAHQHPLVPCARPLQPVAHPALAAALPVAHRAIRHVVAHAIHHPHALMQALAHLRRDLAATRAIHGAARIAMPAALGSRSCVPALIRLWAGGIFARAAARRVPLILRLQRCIAAFGARRESPRRRLRQANIRLSVRRALGVRAWLRIRRFRPRRPRRR